MRIYLSVYGVGSGHSVRCYRLARYLHRKGAKLYLSTYGDGERYYSVKGKELFKDIFFDENIEYAWSKSGLKWSATIANSVMNLDIFIKHFINEYERIKKIKPNIVISDSRISSLAASKAAGYRSIAITNQLYIRTFHKLSDEISSKIFNKVWALADYIMIQDLPPPYTITYSNIVPYLDYVSKKAIFIGLLYDFKSLDNYNVSIDKDIDILFLISAPSRDRINFFQSLYPYTKKFSLNTGYNVYLIEGNPSRNMEKTVGSFHYISWIDDPLKYIRRSKIVILRGGQTSILESILMGTPMIILPAVKQTEQMENARRVEELGLGINVNYEEYLKNNDILANAIERVFSSYNSYLNNINKVKSILLKSGGIEKVYNILWG